MGSRTSIGWTDATWNPVTGCTPVSAGCKNCYAKRITEGWPQNRGKGAFAKIQLHPARLDQPLRWRKPRRIFVCDMGDLFHEDVPEDFIDQVMMVAHSARQHTFQFLTKRAQRMLDYFSLEPFSNIWLGISVEDKGRLSCLDDLRATPAAVRFVSFEPLLGDIGEIDFAGIQWAIVGGESGPNHRPCEIQWIERIVRDCRAAEVPVFVKQDSGPRPGMQGRIPDDLWQLKQFPKETT